MIYNNISSKDSQSNAFNLMNKFHIGLSNSKIYQQDESIICRTFYCFQNGVFILISGSYAYKCVYIIQEDNLKTNKDIFLIRNNVFLLLGSQYK